MPKVIEKAHPYIERKPGVCGGSPVIAGTRIRVLDIAIEYEFLGLSPDEIVQRHPHLTLAQVHDALSFYYENVEEFREEMIRRLRRMASLRRFYPPKYPFKEAE